ncbi:hypothetical protein A2W14_06650 [Candidatus Gottesmanbacteria bacterium RBG_16_37_8]|uniref:NGG1p interacting factor NIF3 n=1 Tax=Candidatus Gottesmanbacteria bacterium RBG_16_37_8 TaxID=1798371 RepID=A0A1F5YRE6_9BACT|nr:MAG: hypothetical protein A2W14_06650 [Candidatus Gottesmanbacteria bacterium RBG_16_37_8]
MKFKFFVYCPDDKKLINQIIKVASAYGAGFYGNYSHVAFITHGEGNWKSEKGAQPHLGKVGQETHAPVAKIEMTCPAEKIKQIVKAIKKIHPWEQVDIEFIQLEE